MWPADDDLSALFDEYGELKREVWEPTRLEMEGWLLRRLRPAWRKRFTRTALEDTANDGLEEGLRWYLKGMPPGPGAGSLLAYSLAACHHLLIKLKDRKKLKEQDSSWLSGSDEYPDLRWEDSESSVELDEVLQGFLATLDGVDSSLFLSVLDPEKKNKKPDRAELLEIENCLLIGSGLMKIMQGYIFKIISTGADRLRTDRAFIEYSPGDRYEVLPGVLTYGEGFDGDKVRMFYYFPDEFPDLYKAKKAIELIVNECARHVVSILSR